MAMKSAVMDGPPFTVPEEEIREHYTGARVRILSQVDASENVKFPGHDWWWATTYAITL